MNRITDEDVLYAYMLTGWAPCAGYVLRRRRETTYACPLMAVVGALYSDSVPAHDVQGDCSIFATLVGFDHDYLTGYIDGFDQTISRKRLIAAYQHGHADGAAMYQQLQQRPGGVTWFPPITLSWPSYSTAANAVTGSTYVYATSSSTAATAIWNITV